MRDLMRRALTRTVVLPMKGKRGKQTVKVQLPPGEALVWGCVLLLVFFVALVLLQIAHLLIMRAWNDAVWAGLTLLLGVFVGAFFSKKA